MLPVGYEGRGNTKGGESIAYNIHNTVAGAGLVAVAGVEGVPVAGSSSAAAGARGAGAAGVVCGQMKNETIVVPLVASDSPGRPCKGSLLLGAHSQPRSTRGNGRPARKASGLIGCCRRAPRCSLPKYMGTTAVRLGETAPGGW